jgi:hypothetical protein
VTRILLKFSKERLPSGRLICLTRSSLVRRKNRISADAVLYVGRTSGQLALCCQAPDLALNPRQGLYHRNHFGFGPEKILAKDTSKDRMCNTPMSLCGVCYHDCAADTSECAPLTHSGCALRLLKHFEQRVIVGT